MEMSYVKVYQDWTKVTSKLKDAEKGRLIDAVVLYATSGIDTSDQLSGNEQYLFPMFQAYIDRDRQALAEYAAKQSANGSQGGRGHKKQKNPPLSDENPKNPPLSDETQKSKEKEKEKEKEVVVPPYPPAGGATTTSYIADNLRGMTAGNWDELRSYLDDGLTMELVNHAVDEAAANGKRNWAYVRQILNRYLDEGIISVEQAKNTKAPKQPEAPRPKYRWVGDDDDC